MRKYKQNHVERLFSNIGKYKEGDVDPWKLENLFSLLLDFPHWSGSSDTCKWIVLVVKQQRELERNRAGELKAGSDRKGTGRAL